MKATYSASTINHKNVYNASTENSSFLKKALNDYIYHMRKTLTIVITLLTLLPFSNIQAQSLIIDSLNTIIKQEKSPNSKRIEAFADLAKITARNNQRDRAMELAQKALKLSYLEDDPGYTGFVQATISYLYSQQDSLKQAYNIMDSALVNATKTDDIILKGRVLLQQGWLENLVDNRGKAYQYMLEALRLFEQKKEQTWLFQSNLYHHLASIQGYWNSPKQQLQYTQLCLETAHKSKDPDAIANAYLSMGSYYLYQSRNKETKQQLDSAKYYYTSILDLTKANQNRIRSKSIQGIAALNMANLYFEFYPIAFKDSASHYINLALEGARKFDQPQILANSYGILSEYALKQNDYQRAEEHLQKAMTEIIASPWGTNRTKSRISNALSRVAEKRGDPAKALEYYKQYMSYDRELFDQEKHSITQKLEVVYQSEKKELALATAKQEAALNKKMNNLYLILISIVLIAIFFVFRAYHFRLKTAKQKQLLLTGLKNEAELQANLKEEETARLEVEQVLLQERLDRLEKELLAGTLHVEEKNQLLSSLTEKLNSLKSTDPMYQQIKRLISKNIEVDKGYDEIKTELTEIRPEFVEGLQKQAEQKLTRLDQKYCFYILMGLTNKEIAAKLNVDPKSIRMARYRIKQKLHLTKDQSLDEFILSLGTKDD